MPATEGPALLTVDLAAIAANYRLLAEKAAPAEAAPAVKADAYGLGMDRVAPALARAGARSFFVAWLAEGIRLRELLPKATIYVLNGAEPGKAAAYPAHRLVPCLDSREAIDEWLAGTPGAPAALHLDTGMSRLGLPPSEWAALAAEPALLARLAPVMVMSHLACADDPDNPMSERQRAMVLEAVRALGLAGRVPRSLANSSGIFRGPDFHLEMVRPGAAIYGLAPLNGRANPMRQPVRLQAKILQVRRVDRGMTVGYGATHRTTRPSLLATISAGYADGIFRALGNRGHACLGAVRVPIVGRVSMDLLTLDVTDAPAALVRRGALVDIIGPGQTVDELAAEAGTIGYEVLTALGSRYPRRYLDDGAAG
jgi:alanine racemase